MKVRYKVPECFVVDEFHGDSISRCFIVFIVGWRLMT
jgi:hypothetical protein